MTQAPPRPSTTGESAPIRAPLWTRGLVLLCTSTVLCYLANYLVGVVLPLYVQELGGDPVVIGLVFTSFSITSFILRPLIGHLTDVWSVRGTIAIGAGLLGALPFPFVLPSLLVAFPANAIRGIGWGAFSSASSTALAHLAPPSRRGEASGQYSIATTATQAFAPAIGLWMLHATGSFNLVFVVGGICGLSALALVLTQFPRIGTGRTTFLGAFHWPKDGITLTTFVEPRVLLASMLLVCLTLTTPVTFAFVPVHAISIGVENISIYFVAAGVTAIAARAVLGRQLDRGSRGGWIVGGYLLLAVGYLVFTRAQGLGGFILGAIFTSFGASLAQPALMALAMDRAAAGRMGKAMATYSMFYRVGEGLGAPLAGALIVAFGYTGMYIGAAAIVLTGVLLAFVNWGTVGRPIARAAA